MKMKSIAVLLFAVLFRPAFGADTHGSVCVAPTPQGPPRTVGSPELFCRSGRVSFKIDSQPAILFSHGVSKAIEVLDVAQKHRVLILCDGKPQQSFTFHFATFQSTDLCLFINDLYQTAQLWERARSPWCRCK
jgi:hypothetical protein